MKKYVKYLHRDRPLQVLNMLNMKKSMW